MAENIVINFEANTQGLQSTIDLLEKLGQLTTKQADAFRKATEEYNKAQQALQKESKIKQLTKELEDLGVKVPAAVNKSKASFIDLKKVLLDVGGALGIAFGTAAIINFGKESFKAFAEAEVRAKQLQIAVGINGGLSKDFEKLIEQSKELQEITVFSDDDIQQVQKAALQFGLTADQVEELIPVIADFASATGQSLDGALEAVIQGTNGMERGLKKYGISLEEGATKSENLANVIDQLNEKFKGQAKILGETAFGATEKLKNKFNELQEDVGSFIASAGESTAAIALWIANGFNPLEEEAEQSALALSKTTEEINKINDAVKSANLVLLNQQLQSLNANGGSASAIKEITDQIKQIRLTDFLNDIEKLSEKELVAKLKAIEDQAKKTKFQIVDQTQLTSKEQITAINQLIEKLKIESKLQDDLNKTVDQTADKKEEQSKDIIKIYDKVQYKSKQVTDEEIKNSNKEYQEKTKYDLAYQQEKSDRTQQEIDEEKQRSIMILELAGSTANELFNISQALADGRIQNLETEQDAILKQYDDQLAALEETRDKERITEARFNTEKKELIKQREKFELDSQKKINEEKRKADIANKAQKIFNIGIATAEGIINYGNNPATAALVPFVIALGAAQLATVLATPLPKYKKGTLSVGGVDTGQDTQLAMLRPGEAVIPTETNKAYHPAIKAIYEGRISSKDMNSFVSMKLKGGDIKNSFALDYDLLAKKLGNEMAWQLRGSNNVNIKNVQDFAKALNSGYDFRRMI